MTCLWVGIVDGQFRVMHQRPAEMPVKSGVWPKATVTPPNNQSTNSARVRTTGRTSIDHASVMPSRFSTGARAGRESVMQEASR